MGSDGWYYGGWKGYSRPDPDVTAWWQAVATLESELKAKVQVCTHSCWHCAGR